jgi:aminopeptidase N
VRVDVALPARAATTVASIDPDDRAYAIVQHEPADIDTIEAAIRRARSPLQRIRVWEGLWHSVRAGRLDPARYVDLALGLLGAEAHPMIVAAVAQRLQIAVDRLGAGMRSPTLSEQLDSFLLEQVRRRPSGLEQVWIQGLIALARTEEGLRALEATALGRRRVGGLVSPALRAEAAVMLVARGAWSGAMALRAVASTSANRTPLRMQIAAAQPGARSKREVFGAWHDARSLPDAAIVAGLDVFNHPAHAEATFPLLAPALRRVPTLYRQRKIFFVNRWIFAFVGGQYSARARQVVRRSLASLKLEAPLRRKLLEAEYELRLAAAIRGHSPAERPRS